MSSASRTAPAKGAKAIARRGAAPASTRADSSAVHSGLSGEMAAPARQTPRATTGHHARLGIAMATRSPGRTPRSRSPAARAAERAASSPRVSVSPVAPSTTARAPGSAAARRSAATATDGSMGGAGQWAAMDGRVDGRHACVPPDVSQQCFVSGNVTPLRYAVKPWDARRSTTRPRASACSTPPSSLSASKGGSRVTVRADRRRGRDEHARGLRALRFQAGPRAGAAPGHVHAPARPPASPRAHATIRART